MCIVLLCCSDKNDDTDSIDDVSDSDAEETASVKAFVIPEDRRSWQAGLMMDTDDNDSDTNSLVGIHGRRNAVSSEGHATSAKKNAIKSKHILFFTLSFRYQLFLDINFYPG